MTPDKIEAAVAAARRGWPVLPCHWIKKDGACSCGEPECGSIGKHPFGVLVPHGHKDATLDETKITTWFSFFPDANLAIRTGPESGLVVLDPDRHNANADGLETLAQLERENGALPETVRALTGGGGQHVLFKHPGFFVKSDKQVLGPGLDVKGDDGLILIEPSDHRSGRRYAFDAAHHPDDVPVADMPPWLVEKLRAASGNGDGNGKSGEFRRDQYDTATILAGLPQGQREGAIFELAHKLRRAEVPENVASALVLEAAAKCSPPFPEKAALNRVRRAYQWGESAGNQDGAETPEVAVTEPTPMPEVLTEEKRTRAAEALAHYVEVVQRYYFVPDLRSHYFAHAVYIANHLPGDPVWSLTVGPPGSGKTESIWPLHTRPDVFEVSTLTEAALLSGTSKKDKAKNSKGGLLREVGDFGILLQKDFTSVLSMNRDKRNEVLGALREVYDGAWNRRVGTDGGQSLSWTGRVGFVGAVTTNIDTHHSVMASMGERFVLYRMPVVDNRKLARSALRNSRRGVAIRNEVAEAVRLLYEAVDLTVEPPELTEAEEERLISLAIFVAQARSAVERDGYKREIELVPDAEAPTRIAKTLGRIIDGLRVLGVDEKTVWSTVEKVAVDCVPTLRTKVLQELAKGDRDTKQIADTIGYPTTTTRRALEDLAAHGLVDRQSEGAGVAHEWSFSNLGDELWTGAFGKKGAKDRASLCVTSTKQTFPETSEEKHTSTPLNFPVHTFDDISGKVPPSSDLSDLDRLVIEQAADEAGL